MKVISHWVALVNAHCSICVLIEMVLKFYKTVWGLHLKQEKKNSTILRKINLIQGTFSEN